MVRARAALASAKANDTKAIPVLIDLLAELNAEERAPVEDFLMALAGEWAPRLQFQTEDDISRHIRRDAWASWWRHTDGATLLAILAKHSLTAETRKKADRLIVHLGDVSFNKRETASRELFALGRLVLPQLHETSKSADAEVARRAKLLIERLKRQPIPHLPMAALRLLALRKPAGAVESLLDYLPHAEDQLHLETARKSLVVLARRDGKPDPVLLRDLSDGPRLLRVAAIKALVEGGGTDGRSAVRKLLKENAPLVRLRAALALALVRERDSIPVLIDLLAVLPAEPFAEAEDALYQLAGDSAPRTPEGGATAERKKSRDAWAVWWKAHAKDADLTRLTDPPCHGFTLICDINGNRVYELDRRGKERWAIDNVQGPTDAVVLPGDRVLIAEHNGRRVTERDFKGRILWSKEGLPGSPVNVQRLPNGNTFIATPNRLIFEVDHTGKVVSSITVPAVSAARRTRQGTLYVLSRNKLCFVMEANGKVKKQFAVNLTLDNPGCLDVTPNGHLLVASVRVNKVVEFDSEGKELRAVEAPGVTTATALPDGHILAACRNTQRVFELDRAGKIVWKHESAGHAYRARRR